MKKLGLNILREKFLSFYESKEHLRRASFPLVPIGDKSLLLINAGMAPLKRYFTGEFEPPAHRMTTCQKCVRTLDIDNVGVTARHGTFFEMLGNFSFGDYFKREAISWAWEFLTKCIEIPENLLWVSVFTDDDEAYGIWHNEIGIPASRIVRLGRDDNFWEIGSGPCGPCSEIYFDRGEKYGCGSPDCKPGCDCDRYIEIWNLVFTQFDSDGAGNYTPLSHPNIDTGMGLERLACVMQDVSNLFEVDTIRNIMESVCRAAKVEYGTDKKRDVSLRVITDHIRSSVFLISDGVIPSNEGRGYILRRLIRRAARHGRLLGISGTFLGNIVDVVAHENADAYPELTARLDYIKKVVFMEEERFAQTIDSGLVLLEERISALCAKGKTVMSGSDVFKLSDTFGFSVDLTREITAERGITLDEEGYRALLTEQKERARGARAAMGDFSWTAETFEFLGDLPQTVFTGYTGTEETATVLALAVIDGEAKELVGSVSDGNVIVILDRTPFYGEGGGQVGDSGRLFSDSVEIEVTDTKKHNGIFMHIGKIKSGTVSTGDVVRAGIDTVRRDAIKRNHSSVHMLQAALRTVLGSHVEQAGSYVDEYRSRFDFSHFTAVTPEELRRIEDIVNTAILAGHSIETFETDIETAKSMGAMALFGEKYGHIVRVVKMGDYSTELCGGTHLDNTAKAGLYRIVSESSVASGVRRIEAVTGLGVLGLLSEKEAQIAETAKILKSPNTADIGKKALSLQNELKAAKHEIEQLNLKLAGARVAQLTSGAETVGSIRLITEKTENTPLDVARAICDELKANNPDIVAVLSVNCDGKANFVCACGKDAVAHGAHAGNIAKAAAQLCGANGGGRPDSATSGVSDISKIDSALASVRSMLNLKS